MSKRRVLLVAVAGFAGALLLFRVFVLPDLVFERMMSEVVGDDRTPADVGLPFEDASFEVGGDRLVAWFVAPDQPEPLAFLLFHGDGETVADFLRVQRLLYDEGYPSLVYDYGGFGHSEGRYSRRILGAEPRAAVDALVHRVSDETRIVVLGHSFGAAVSVEALHDYDVPRLHAVVFNSGPPALRDILNEVAGIPAPVTWFLPNLVNAKVDIADFEVPILVIASEADEVVPYGLTLRVYEGATEPKRLLAFKDTDHNYLTRADPEWWAPVFEWLAGL